MAFQLCHALALVVLSVVGATQVSPIEKVISLLEGMKGEIEKEAKAEAVTYDKFACFCKDTTKTKSTSVTTGQDTIDKLSASIAENTALKAADETSVQGLKAKKEEYSADLEKNTVRCAKEKAEYEANAADLNKAISSLKGALKAMSDKKKAMDSVKASAVLLDVGSSVRETLELADAMGLIVDTKHKATKAFLQQGDTVDPADAEYKYHSSDLVDLLTSLQKDFTDQKSTLDTEWGKNEKACIDIKKSLTGKIETNTKETKTTDEKISKLATSIADDRGKLVEAQDLMKDDELYLKDLTSRCEKRAVEWDQRSQMRNGEIEAISTALKVLGDKVKPAADEVNKRAFMQQPDGKKAPAAAKSTLAKQPVKAAVTKPAVTETKKAVASKVETPSKVVTSFLQRMAVSAHENELSNLEAQAKEKAVVAIRDEGIRLGSPVLTALAMQVAADPFKKVKQLIQGLVERLIREAASEATKKGFCDTELGKAYKDRDFRFTEVKKLGAEIAVLTAKEDSLTEEIDALTKSLAALNKAVEEGTKLRKTEKAENEKTLSTARDGLDAVKEALLVLRSFYKEAAKAAVLLQASPVDEDTAGAGFSGTYTGKQEGSNAVLGLLETIVSDFDRTIRTTESAEEEAARAFVEFNRASKVDIGGKTTKKELDEQDLKTTQNKLNVDRADMKRNMDLVDDAVKTLMELKPTCIDTGMSYSERVAKREEEVKALKKALCILDTEKVEAECK